MPAAFAASSASAAGSVVLGEVTLNYSQRLVENSNGSYTLTLVLDAQAEHRDKNVNSTITQNGYYTAPADGDYLVELWGGDGSPGGTAANPASSGGAGGYVYGIVSLKKGETLFYTLGGNGSRTQSSGTGGGVNGPGGGGGAMTASIVGGGGGYSAVYLYGAGEFESGYFADDGEYGGNSVTDGDRTSRFIMIAGGGGGGGGQSSDGDYSPDGGAAGRIGSTAVSDSSAGVSGTVFAGSNGLSSSTNDNYVGEGGAVDPGSYSDTWSTAFKSAQGNNWLGNATANLPGGAGGSGNLNGGAGGAGYAGGGGGIMSSMFTATAVGGGGGGSSFLADSVDYASVDTDLLKKTNESISGGAIAIQLLGLDTSYLESVDVDFTGSEYFDVTVNGEPAQANPAATTVATSLNGGEAVTLTLNFTRKTGFAGGNAVPLLEDERITVTAGAHTANIYLQPACSAVNVPLNFQMVTRSLAYDPGSNPAGIRVGSLYEDNYADVRDSLADHWQYDFIESIGEYIVTDLNGTVLGDEDMVAPVATTAYPVSFTVTPKGGTPAVVGDPVTTKEYPGYGMVAVTENNQFVLANNLVISERSLTPGQDANGNATYTLSLGLVAETIGKGYVVEIDQWTPPQPDPETYEPSKYYTTTEPKTFQAPYDGWYYVEVYGGDGGQGSNAQLGGKGGAGADGTEIRCYVYLEAEEILSFVIGNAGDTGTHTEGGIAGIGRENYGGDGGGYTAVFRGTDTQTALPFIIAGGGGGGGGAASWNGGKDALQNTATPNTDLPDTNEAIKNTYAGVKGGTGSGTTGGNAGASAPSYYNTGECSTEKPTEVTTAGTAGAKDSGYTDGFVQVTALQYDPVTDVTYEDTSNNQTFDEEGYVAELTAQLQDYDLTANISKYFDVTSVTLEGANPGNVNKGQTVSVENITPTNITIQTWNEETGEYEDGLYVTEGTFEVKASTEFTINIVLTPKEGFLGGNDVPLLAYGEPDSTDNTTSIAISKGDYDPEDVPCVTENDFVNIAIPDDAVSGTINVPTAPEIVRGQIVEHYELYTVEDHGAPADAWKADFVDFNTTLTYQATGKAVNEDPLAPTETTYYVVTLSVDPKAEPIRATNSAATGVSKSRGEDKASDPVVIYVLPVVEYHLTNLNHANATELDGNNRFVIEQGNSFEDTLSTYTAPNGKVYLLPDSITVTRTSSGGTVTTLEEGTDYDYNKVTGVIFIEKKDLGYDLYTIYAEGVLKEPLTITYYYQQSPDDTTGVQVAGPEFDSGDSLTAANAGIPEHTEYEGYTFGWQWLGYDEMPTTITENLVAIGSYSPNPYTLTIQCVIDGVVQTETTQTVLYMEEYTVTAPAIDGYAPDKASETDVMDSTAGKTVTFTYHKTDGWLTIHYVKADGTQAAAPYTGEVTLGESYTIASPAITGYTADLTSVVIGTVTQEQVNNGIVVTVTYTPNLYTISFNPNGGTCDTTPYRVEYNNVYGYDPINKTAKPLPTPILSGFTFDGWYLGDVKIESSTTVTITVDSTLVAKWTQITTYTLTIKYVYENGTQAAESYTAQLEAGAEYSEVSPLIDGYTADILTVSGTMGSDHALITVTYIKNARTVTVYYCYANGDPIDAALLGIAANPTLMELMPGDHTITAPALTGYTTPTAKTITVEPGVDMTITFYYTVQETVVSVTITWGELNFVYDGGVWQPESHTYDPAPSFTPEKTGYNTVTVINSAESTIPVDVTISYAANPGYATVDGYFTTASYSTGAVIEEWTLTVGEEKKVYLWLTGMLNSAQSGTFESGICTVTISSAEGG